MPVGCFKASLGAESDIFVLCEKRIKAIQNGHGKPAGICGHVVVLSLCVAISLLLYVGREMRAQIEVWRRMSDEK